jgi:hypothetical protein
MSCHNINDVDKLKAYLSVIILLCLIGLCVFVCLAIRSQLAEEKLLSAETSQQDRVYQEVQAQEGNENFIKIQGCIGEEPAYETVLPSIATERPMTMFERWEWDDKMYRYSCTKKT